MDDWFLMSSVWPNVALCALYYYIIRIWGPKFMKDREPYNIQTLITAYNLFQTLFSLWIFWKATRFWLTGANLRPKEYLFILCFIFRQVQLAVSACGLQLHPGWV